MDILIIGNGFDIAHGLPTTYMQFLDICKQVKSYRVSFADGKVIVSVRSNNSEKRKIFNMFVESLGLEYYREFHKIVCNNFWINHFLNKKHLGEKWIDFEEEIEKVLQEIKGIEIDKKEETIGSINEKIDVFVKKYNNKIRTYRDLYNQLIVEHRKLIRLLELYMGAYVSKMNVSGKEMFLYHPYDYIVSFNYTNTFEKIYGSYVKTCYIHGYAKDYNNKTNNMVLGFDDHYIKNIDMIAEFIPFEKYYQRIVNKNDSSYFEWIEKCKNRCDVNIHIYGHSCAPSDGDILRKFLLIENAKKIIYCVDEIDRADKIRNLAIVLEPDNLIKITSGENPELSFEMIDE